MFETSTHSSSGWLIVVGKEKFREFRDAVMSRRHRVSRNNEKAFLRHITSRCVKHLARPNQTITDWLGYTSLICRKNNDLLSTSGCDT